MKPRLFAALILFALVGCNSPAPKPPPDIEPSSCEELHEGKLVPVKPARGLSAKFNTVQQAILPVSSPTLINGVPAEPKDWPASVYSSADGSRCSATVIGERTVVIAAHCVANGRRIAFSAGSNGYDAVCSHHPSYRSNSTADWALCYTSRPVTGIPFEVLGISQKLSVGQELRLTGYGCIRPGGGGGNDGIFRIGKSVIRSLPSGTNYDTVTRGGVGSAALCFGDSGGAVYLELEDGSRPVVGINSRGDIRSTSYLSSANLPVFADFATDWSAKNGNTRICGLHKDAVGCRGEKEPEPEPEPEPEDPTRKFVVKTKAACVEGVVSKGYESKKDAIKAGVKAALEQF